MKPTVAITGGTGLLGEALRPVLHERTVVVLSRREPVLRANEIWAPFNLGAHVELPSLPAGSTLCHMAYAMGQHEHNLGYNLRAIAAVNACQAVTHVVLLSSCSVYGAGTRGTIDEDTPLLPDSDYARTKAACEGAWHERLRNDCRLTVLRPTSVVASDGLAFRALARDAIQRPWRGVLKRGLQSRNTVHLVAIDNVVAAIRFVLDRDGTVRRTFIVSDDDAAPNADYAAMQDFVRAQLGMAPLRTLPLPRAFERPVGALLGKPLGVRRQFSSVRLADAGFVRPTRLEDQLVTAVRRQFADLLRTMPR